MVLKANSLVKPSSNTLNVGVPTFSSTSACRGGFTPPSSPVFVVAELQIGHPHPSLKFQTGLKTGHYTKQPAASRSVTQ
jgi:hypothetical protein